MKHKWLKNILQLGTNVSFELLNTFIPVFISFHNSVRFCDKSKRSQKSRVINSSLVNRILKSLGSMGYETYRYFEFKGWLEKLIFCFYKTIKVNETQPLSLKLLSEYPNEKMSYWIYYFM